MHLQMKNAARGCQKIKWARCNMEFSAYFFFFFLGLHQQWEGWKKERELMTLARPLRITKIFFPKKERLFLARNGSEKKENSAAHKDQNTAINRESVLTLGITFADGTNIWALLCIITWLQLFAFIQSSCSFSRRPQCCWASSQSFVIPPFMRWCMHERVNGRIRRCCKVSPSIHSFIGQSS